MREVDWARKGLDGLPGRVARVEADPGRSGFLALVRYAPGKFYERERVVHVRFGVLLLRGPVLLCERWLQRLSYHRYGPDFVKVKGAMHK